MSGDTLRDLDHAVLEAVKSVLESIRQKPMPEKGEPPDSRADFLKGPLIRDAIARLAGTVDGASGME